MFNELFVFEKTYIEGLYIVNNLCVDNQKFFYDKETFKKNGLNMEFIQDNESYSKKNVLRGFHIQINKPQGKLIHALYGKIQDVVIDLRKNSKTYGKWCSVELSDENNKSLYIPEGFAHGFLVLSDYAKIEFKVSNYWNPADEIGIPWNDDFFKIEWELNGNSPIIAEKDLNYINFTENDTFNHFL